MLNKVEKSSFEPEGEFETPYARAMQMFDDLIGNNVKRAKNWRLAFFIEGILLFIAVSGLIAVALKSEIVPYIIEVDRLGTVSLVGKAIQKGHYEPSQGAAKHFLGEFVDNIRVIPTDPILLKKRILKAYHFVTPKGKIILDNEMMEYKPFEIINNNSVTIEIRGVPRIAQNSYQVEWQENTYSSQGVIQQTNYYTATFSIVIQKPKTEEEILINPLGIYIDFFSISKRFKEGTNS